MTGRVADDRWVTAGIVLREMQIQDYAAVMALWADTEHLTLRDADSREQIGRYLQHNPGLSFVACAGSEVMGAVLAGTDGRRGYLQHLAVGRAYRGLGVGRALVWQCIAALAAIGIGKTHLFVLQTNASAQTFYQHLGWQQRDDLNLFSYNATGHSHL